MALRLITAPAVEPVTLVEAKQHLRVDFDDDDALIEGMLEAARVFCEKFTARAFVTQTWELVIDEFPEEEIEIPLPPLQSVTSIKYDDGDGVEQTLGTLLYTVDSASQPGWVVPVTAGWPSDLFDGINAVRIRFVAGYDPSEDSPVDLAAKVPRSIKSAILLYLGQLYANRENIIVGTSAVTLPSGSVEHLLRQFTVQRGMA